MAKVTKKTTAKSGGRGAASKGAASKTKAGAHKSAASKKTTGGQKKAPATTTAKKPSATAKYEQVGAPWWKRLPLPD